MKLLKDTSTGKFIWHPSCTELYKVFLNNVYSNPAEFEGCRFYAVNAREYMENKLLINLYAQADVKVSSEMLLPFKMVSLDFHVRASIAMYMPIKRNLDHLYEEVQKNPSRLFEIAQKAKDLVFNESKPCISCGTVCHMPDVSDHTELSKEARSELMRLSEENRDFCFACGKEIVMRVADFKMRSCSDMVKVNTISALCHELDNIDLNDVNFNFDKAQKLIRHLMGHITKSSMTVVAGDDVIREESNKNQPIKESDITKPSQLPPWLN